MSEISDKSDKFVLRYSNFFSFYLDSGHSVLNIGSWEGDYYIRHRVIVATDPRYERW